MKRSRGRGRRPQHNNQGGGGGGGNYNNPNRSYDSNGPEVKIRGNASTVYEKYLQLARDANSSGDRVMAENYLQHAEHYYRILAAQQAQQQQYAQQQAQNQQNNGGQQNGNGQYRGPNGNGEQPYVQDAQPQQAGPSFSLNESQNEEEGEEEAAD
ncbi:MAG: DUF4167 domain-containing protein [Proteobacteria bacterium]|nr:DUF4167 domain-containing protein [Pseudomonadota bacterium]